MTESIFFDIHIQAVLGEKWAKYFLPFSLVPGANETILSGAVHDQAELFGILLKIRDAGLTLVSLGPADRQNGASEIQNPHMPV